MKKNKNFSTLLTKFFTARLIQQKNVSAHTISSYRDTFKLMLQFAKKTIGKDPSELSFEDIDASFVMSFLRNLEKVRGITARSRNFRLTAIRSFFDIYHLSYLNMVNKFKVYWQFLPRNTRLI